MTYRRATRVLWILLGLAFAVSVVHYTDNYLSYDAYPAPEAHSHVPAPSRTVVGASWFVFTAVGLLGVRWWRRRRIRAASAAVVGYALSGLVGLGHYLVPGASQMPWWRHTHVVADIICGVALVVFALWAVRHAATLTSARQGPAPEDP